MAWYPPEYVERIRADQAAAGGALPAAAADQGAARRAPAAHAARRGRPPRRTCSTGSPSSASSRPTTDGYDPDDVAVIAAIARFRAGGYDEALGFTVYDTLRYRDALRAAGRARRSRCWSSGWARWTRARGGDRPRRPRAAARADRRDALEDAARGAAPRHQRTRWRSMTPQPARSRPAGRERAGERAERLLVVRRDQQQVLRARARRRGGEAEVADAREAAERLRRDVRRVAVDPDRALGAVDAVVQPVDEVPGHRAAVASSPAPADHHHDIGAGAGRPTRRPARAARPAGRAPSRAPARAACASTSRPSARPTGRPARRPGRARRGRRRAPASRRPGRAGGTSARAAARRPRRPTRRCAPARPARSRRTASARGRSRRSRSRPSASSCRVSSRLRD